VIDLKLIASASQRHCVVQSRCYEFVDASDGGPNKLDVPVDNVPIAFVLSCRQVYLEALLILHQRNTFRFLVHEFETVLLAALYLPDIRSIYLYHDYTTCSHPPWSAVVPLLQQMPIERLVFEFSLPRLDWTGFSPHKGLLDIPWARSVIGIRNLRYLDLFFKDGDPPEHPLYRSIIAQKMRDVMIGPGADERYEELLKSKEFEAAQ
jgi:hypothetical protein